MHIYIHVPFCDSKCGYCAFFSQIDSMDHMDSYFDSMAFEIKEGLRIHSIKNISSIFIGGGTPNLASPRHYEKIFSLLSPLYEQNIEISIESNPNSLSRQWLQEIKNMGVNRLSLGIQSFYSDKLALLERQHSPRDIEMALESASSIFDNISFDLIYDCALDSKSRLEKELEMALKLCPSHLSLYSLSIDKQSHFAINNKYEKLSKESLSSFVRDFLCDKGAKHYEVSNFALPKKCKHNLGYWSSEEYLGFGAGSVGRIGNNRFYAPKNLEAYISNPLQRKVEILSQKDLDFEEVFLGLRSIVGVRKELLESNRLELVLNEGLCFSIKDRIYAKDLFLADELALYLTP